VRTLEDIQILGKEESQVPIYWNKSNSKKEILLPAQFPGTSLTVEAVCTADLSRKRPCITMKNNTNQTTFIKKGAIIGNIIASSDDTSEDKISYFDIINENPQNELLNYFKLDHVEEPIRKRLEDLIIKYEKNNTHTRKTDWLH